MIVGPTTSLVEFRKKVGGKFTWVGVTTSHNLPENPAVCERGADSPEDRDLQTADDHVRKPVAAAEALAVSRLIVVGIECVDRSNPIRELSRDGQRKHGTDGFAHNSYLTQIQSFEKADDASAHVGLIVLR